MESPTAVVGSPDGISNFANPSIANSPHDVENALIHPYGMSDEAFEKARSRLLLACELTGLTPSALAAAGKMAATTITRPINRKTDSLPGTRTMEKVDQLVRRHIASVAASDPDQANALLSRWEGRSATGHASGLSVISDSMLTVAVRGYVQAGHWADAAELPPDEWENISVPRPDGHREYFGLRVRGNSMNLEYPEGTILICVPLYKYDHAIEPGDHLVVHRWDDCGQVEATVKELLIGPDGRHWLCPKSTDTSWTPIIVPDTPRGFGEHGEAARIEIVAIVVADYRVRKRGSVSS